MLDEVDGGSVSRDGVLPGNPPDARGVPASLAHRRTRFGRPPALLAGDRGTSSPENERTAQQAGVTRVAFPQPGHTTPERRAHERRRWFRRAQRFRSGIEGRISLLRRRVGWRRRRNRGAAGLERWVGWGVLAHDRRVIARTAARRRAA